MVHTSLAGMLAGMHEAGAHAISEQPLDRNVQWFRGGKKKKVRRQPARPARGWYARTVLSARGWSARGWQAYTRQVCRQAGRPARAGTQAQCCQHAAGPHVAGRQARDRYAGRQAGSHGLVRRPAGRQAGIHETDTQAGSQARTGWYAGR